MKFYRIERTQFLRTDLATAWEFFSDPRNLTLITPPSLGFEVTCDLPERMFQGMIITYRLTPFRPIAITWVTEITQVAEPFLFVDEQRKGPYRFWHHQHHFRAAGDGVEMRDVVTYALPLGWPGRMASPVVRRRLQSIFEFRRQVLAARF